MIGIAKNFFGVATLAATAAVVLMGCASGPFSALSTGSSMRIEVEVYKGPLTKDKEVQIGELFGVIQEARAGLYLFRIGADTYFEQLGCKVTNKSDDCKKLESVISSADNLIVSTEKLVRDYKIDTLVEALKNFKYGKSAPVREKGADMLVEFAVKISALATQFKAKAFFYASDQYKTVPKDETVRAKLTDFTTLTSEFSRQIAGRTTVLYKQVAENESGKKLAVSDHLRDASPTVFLNLYNWYDATYASSEEKTGLTAADRVRLGKQLFADHYWTKINEVYASGQGDVSMAFIKDDIGNWNLKSFENNPTELLDAYRELSLAGIQAATEVAANIASGGGAPAALSLASNFALGRVGSSRTALANDIRVESLHANAQAELSDLRDKVKGQLQKYVDPVNESREAYKTAKKGGNGIEGVEKKQVAFNKAESNYQVASAEEAAERKKLDEQKTALMETRKEMKETLDKLVELEQAEQPGTPPSPAAKALLEHQNALKEREKDEHEAVSATEKSVKELEANLEKQKTAKENAHTELVEAQKKADEALAEFNKAEQELQEFTQGALFEARQILDVHRRVIDALKTSQVSREQGVGNNALGGTQQAAAKSVRTLLRDQ
jgi:hypothetical protein